MGYSPSQGTPSIKFADGTGCESEVSCPTTQRNVSGQGLKPTVRYGDQHTNALVNIAVGGNSFHHFSRKRSDTRYLPVDGTWGLKIIFPVSSGLSVHDKNDQGII